MLKKLKLNGSMKTYGPSRTNTPKRCPFHIGEWNAKVGSQEISGETGKFGLGVQNKAGQRLIEFCQEKALVIENTLFQNTREDSTHGHHLMANTEIRLFSYFTLHPFTVHLKKTL